MSFFVEVWRDVFVGVWFMSSSMCILPSSLLLLDWSVILSMFVLRSKLEVSYEGVSPVNQFYPTACRLPMGSDLDNDEASISRLGENIELVRLG